MYVCLYMYEKRVFQAKGHVCMMPPHTHTPTHMHTHTCIQRCALQCSILTSCCSSLFSYYQQRPKVISPTTLQHRIQSCGVQWDPIAGTDGCGAGW